MSLVWPNILYGFLNKTLACLQNCNRQLQLQQSIWFEGQHLVRHFVLVETNGQNEYSNIIIIKSYFDLAPQICHKCHWGFLGVTRPIIYCHSLNSTSTQVESDKVISWFTHHHHLNFEGTFSQPRKRIFGVQPYFYPTRWNMKNMSWMVLIHCPPLHVPHWTVHINFIVRMGRIGHI